MSKCVLILALLFVISGLSAQSDTILINDDLQLIHVKDSVFVHVSYVNSERYGRFSNNGMLLVRNGEAVMVDTPTSNDQTKTLCEYLKAIMSIEVKCFVAGHFHNDCIGGLEYLHSIGVKSLASQLTVDKCKEEGLPIPKIVFTKEYDCLFHNTPIECRYWGGAHSFDNITVWLPNQHILFGGCMVKQVGSMGLGNLSDARVDEWDITLEKILYAYPNAINVIPGHGSLCDLQAITYTIKLVQKEQGSQ